MAALLHPAMALGGQVRAAPAPRQPAPICLPARPCSSSSSASSLSRYSRSSVLASAARRRGRPPPPPTSEEEEQEEAAEAAAAQQQQQQQQEGAAAAAAEQEAGEGAEAAVALGSEAVAHSGQPQQVEVTEEVEEEVEHVVEPLTLQLVAQRTQTWITTTTPGKVAVGAVAALLAGSLALATWRAWQKATTGRAKRMRQIDLNRGLVDGLNKYLPSNRAGLTPGVLRGLQRSSGFTAVEVFRKYLWYLLRERKFDQGAVDDLVHLKVGLGLSDDEVGEALRERSQRAYEKYGTLMLNTEGMTLTGAQRKATCQALFRKMLYLAECQKLVGAAALDAREHIADMRKIFGATEEDLERLRIKNLYEAEVDLEAMMVIETDVDEAEDGPAPPPPKPDGGSGSGAGAAKAP